VGRGSGEVSREERSRERSREEQIEGREREKGLIVGRVIGEW
jgi:hypothetical protein